MSKVWEDLSISDNTTVLSYPWSIMASNTTKNESIWTLSVPIKAQYNFQWKFYHTAWIKVDWVQVVWYSNNSDDNYATRNANVTLEPNDYLIQWYASSSSSYWNSEVKEIVVKRNAIFLQKQWVNWFPKDEKLIWEIWNITIFWIHWDDLYIWEEVSSVTAWSITLWKAVWFIKFWKYKIPYYL